MKVTKFKFHPHGYYEPTPKNLRKFGDALLGISQFAAGYSVVSDSPNSTIFFLVVGVIGKFLTNFFVEETDVTKLSQDEQNL